MLCGGGGGYPLFLQHREWGDWVRIRPTPYTRIIKRESKYRSVLSTHRLLVFFLSILSLKLSGRILGAVVVIAANAGGAWTPIGDVTTTMLWIHGQISTLPTMKVCRVLLSRPT